MSILFNSKEKIFYIQTKNSTYAMQVVYNRYVLHLYYGKKREDISPWQERIVSFAPYDADIGVKFSLDTAPTELSFFGSGDLRDTGIKINNQNGDCTTDFLFESARIFKGRINFDDMPYSRGGDETLEIVYFDKVSNCRLKSYYTLFYETDTITRYVVFENVGNDVLRIENALGCQLDFENVDFEWSCLGGLYYWERDIITYPLHFGRQSIYSKRGHSSAQANPYSMLKTPMTTENQGECYAMEFVYSGDFEMQAELSYDKRVRWMAGLNRETVAWSLEGGTTFTTPETILVYSDKGTNGLMRNLHNHLRQHIINPKFVDKQRPVVINTWEAVNFNINEEVLLQFADRAVEMGIDTLVVDDGWYGKRNDDTSSLGDWFINNEKFKDGLKAFSEKVHKKGLKLGIWIEPEMINPNSELYRQHPEWVLRCKDRESKLSRNQLLLDMTNNEAIDYVVAMIKNALQDVQLEYIKWDFNRSIAESGSLMLSKEKQCEVKHRFVLGTYRMHKLLTEAFPNALFEGCSGGGGRFDAGMLFYCPQIWTSDNTDPIDRLKIQRGTMIAYPLSTISAHVSHTLLNDLEEKPNHDFRFRVALGGVLGYELNVTKLNQREIEEIREQIASYRKISPLILSGDAYILEGLQKGEYGFYVLSKDETEYYFEYFTFNEEFEDREFVLRTERKNLVLRVKKSEGKMIGSQKACFYYFQSGKIFLD